MIVSKWTKVHVKKLREDALRITQEDLSGITGFAVGTVQKWEQRATVERPVVGRSAEVLDSLLADLTPPQLARFKEALTQADPRVDMHPGHTVTPPPVVGGTDVREVDNDVKRRDFGRLAAAGAAAILLPGDSASIGPTDVTRLLNGVEMLEREDQQSGGGGLVDFAVEQLALAQHKIETCTYDSATGNAFISATGQLAVEAGWLAYDADRHPLARRCYADAIALGTEADDPDLIAHTCLNAANQSVALSRAG
ncbi:helix-turn-helix domain-containing protein, partial [Paenibacillus sp. NPDC056722]|uniref:helix-turn-helix domain-containing protein n=1 Tax=Paenibacillus sp. NPDC056722 TaxID=3345924 RepID=UPI0036C38D42